MNNSTRIPAGWYPDPLGLPQLRWWDNTAWTEHTSDSREPLVEQTSVITVTPRLAWADDDPDAVALREDPSGVDTAPATDTVTGDPTASAATASAPREIEAPDAVTTIDLLADAPSPNAEFIDAVAPDGAAPGSSQPTVRAAWAAVAEIISSATREEEPSVVTVRSDAFPPLLIDLADRGYWWEVPLADFPVDAVGLTASTAPRDGHILPATAGYDTDPVLWAVATAAFPASLAPWLNDDDRHRLRRWPSITELHHDPDQLRMTSMLSHAPLAASELAAIAGTTLPAAQRLVSALSLMGILRHFPADAAASASTPSAAPSVAAPPPQVVPRGLLGRFLARLGR